jgi:hypothetical protein
LFDRIESWQILRHPHVLQVFGVSPLDANPPFIISRYYPNGDANEFLANNPVADRAKIVSDDVALMHDIYISVKFVKDVRMCSWDAIPSWGKFSFHSSFSTGNNSHRCLSA